MKSNSQIKYFNTSKECAEELSKAIIEDLLRDFDVISQSNPNKVSLALSGGSTPKLLWQSLNEAKMDWQKVNVILVDERWLPITDENSNQRNLFQNWSLLPKSSFVEAYSAAATPEEGQKIYESRLGKISWPLSVTVLGMGDDGHTCSWFPDSENLNRLIQNDSQVLCLATRAPSAKWPRMTLTLPAILNSKRIYLHISGEKKIRLLKTALLAGDPKELPIRFILQQEQTPVFIFASKEG